MFSLSLLVALTAVSQFDLEFSTVTTELCSPRGLAVRDGAVWVAESGVGGPSPCMMSPEGESCYGPSGSIRRVDPDTGAKSFEVSGLYSSATGGGAGSAVGPQDIAFAPNGDLLILVGFGSSYNVTRFQEDGATVAWQAASLLRRTNGNTVVKVADVGAEENSNDFDGAGVDTNPFSLAVVPTMAAPGMGMGMEMGMGMGNEASYRVVVADAGANSVFSVNPSTSNVALGTVLPTHTRPCIPCGDPAPFCCVTGLTYQTQSVPTRILTRPGHPDELYQGELTGIFWNNDVASIHKLDASTLQIAEQDFLTGFNSIISMAFDGPDRLYVLEQNFLQFSTSLSGPNRLTRVDMKTKAKTVLTTNLSFATALLVDGSWLYASSNALTNPEGCSGTLQKVNLRRRRPAPPQA